SARPVSGSWSCSGRPSDKAAGTRTFSSETGRRGVSPIILCTGAEGYRVSRDFVQQAGIAFGSMLDDGLSGFVGRKVSLSRRAVGVKIVHHPADGDRACQSQNGILLGNGAGGGHEILGQFHCNEIL